MRFVSGWSTEHDPPELKEIKTLVERLHSGTRHEDKRDALKGLTALSERPELQQVRFLRHHYDAAGSDSAAPILTFGRSMIHHSPLAPASSF